MYSLMRLAVVVVTEPFKKMSNHRISIGSTPSTQSRDVPLKSSLKQNLPQTSLEEYAKKHRSVHFSGEIDSRDFEISLVAAIDKTGKFSLWINLMLVLSTWPIIIVALQNAIFSVKETANFKCYIPELLRSQWSLEMKENISTPNMEGILMNNCYMYKINYSWLLSVPYVRALEYVDKNREVLQIMNCSGAISDHMDSNGFTYIDGIQMHNFCKKYSQKYLWISGLFGRMFTDFLMGVAADIFGRKIIIQVNTLICLCGLIVLLFSKSTWALLVGRILTASGGYASSFIFYLYFTEICSKSWRPLLCQMVFVGWGIGYLLAPILLYNVQHWWYLHCTVVTLTLVSLFAMWYIPESPRWLLTRKLYKKTLEVLCELDDTLSYPNLELYDLSAKRQTVLQQLEIFKCAALGGRIFKSALIFVTSTMTFYAARSESKHLNIGLYNYFIILAVIPVIHPLTATGLINFLGRKLSIVCLYAILAILYFAIIFEASHYEGDFLLFLLTINFSTIASNIVMQHTVEIYPVAFSGTILGFCTSFGTTVLILEDVFQHLVHIKCIKYFWYIMLIVLAMAIVYYLPETSGKDLPLNECEAKLL